MNSAIIAAVHLSVKHSFSKTPQTSIRLLTGLGVEGDAHAGVTVKHRSRVAADPAQPNLRQVHLLHEELFEELREKGFEVNAGELGENITTSGVKLLELPRHSKLYIGSQAVVEVTGLRNPCAQINTFQPGLLAAVLDKNENGELLRKAGIMSVVLVGGEVYPGDKIQVELPEKPFLRLERV